MEFRDKLEGFRNRVEELAGQPSGPGVSRTTEAIKDALGAMVSPGQEDLVSGRVRDIVSFHEAAGWRITSDSSSGPFERVRLEHGEVERSLLATTFGVSIIVLSQGGPDSEESSTTGPSEARTGLRLRLR